tara:strand:+ start:17509 stop:18372 length:864 start_codon:yes stop_codon:yes gene_type:complete
MKSALLQQISLKLLQNSYTVKHLKGCIDLVARNEEHILLLKIVQDANSLQQETIEQLKRIAQGINATTLVISEKAGHILQDNVVYMRHGLYVITQKTLNNALQHKLPFVFSQQSGLTAQLLATQLQQKLEERNMSLGTLSRKLGVSTRMVVKYTQGDSEISIQRALKLHTALGGEVFAPINIFITRHGELVSKPTVLSEKYQDLGFETITTKKAPFDLIAKQKQELILTKVGDKVSKQIGELSHLIDAQDLVIFTKKKPRDVPALTQREFLEFEESKELMKFLKEFN